MSRGKLPGLVIEAFDLSRKRPREIGSAKVAAANVSGIFFAKIRLICRKSG